MQQSLAQLKIEAPVISLFGSGHSILELSEAELADLRAHTFMWTLNYAPIQLKGHLNMWSDQRTTDYLTAHYQEKPVECLLLGRKGRVNGKLAHQINYLFDPTAEKLGGNYTIVWALQLIQRYWSDKTVLLFGVDMYTHDPRQSKWYDQFTRFDQVKRGKHFPVQENFDKCARQLEQYVRPQGVYNCNLRSGLGCFEKRRWRDLPIASRKFKYHKNHWQDIPKTTEPNLQDDVMVVKKNHAEVIHILNKLPIGTQLGLQLHPDEWRNKRDITDRLSTVLSNFKISDNRGYILSIATLRGMLLTNLAHPSWCAFNEAYFHLQIEKS